MTSYKKEVEKLHHITRNEKLEQASFIIVKNLKYETPLCNK